VENAAEVHYPEMIKSRLCITSKGGYFVFGGGMMKAKTLYISGIMVLAIMLLFVLTSTAKAAAITADTTGGATLTGTGPWTLTMSGSTAGSVTVRITDSQTPGRTCDVTVGYTPCVLTVAATKSAANNEKISIAATGGTLPYVYELTTATATGAAIDPLSGDYLAPKAGATEEIESIMATDTEGCIGTTTVKISTDAVAVTTTDSGTVSVTINGPEGATYANTGVGSLADNVFSAGAVNGVGVVNVTATSGEWAKVVILVKDGISTVKNPVPVEDVNMDGSIDCHDYDEICKLIPEVGLDCYCSTWNDVIAMYDKYINGEATWADVIAVYYNYVGSIH